MDKPLAIVDVETTGTSAAYGRIIEIAILRIEKGKVKRQFSTLINPDCPIPFQIEQITGISARDVENAPSFSSVAREVYKLLDGAIFVAHNARFDYGFIKNEFRRLGKTFTARCLCTVKLSRKLYSAHRNHDLSSIISRFGIACTNRHRALGDAEATYEFLKIAESSADPATFNSAVEKILKTGSTPANVNQKDVDALPESCGVYLMYGREGELLYVGKSVNVRDRVRSHFSSDHTSPREMKMCQQIHRLEVRPTAGELGALLLESKLIKELRPIYNVASRRHRDIVVARSSTTSTGYTEVGLEEIDRIEPGEYSSILGIFKHTTQAKEYLERIAKEHRLCHKLLGLQRTNSYCFAYHLHQCDGACAGEEDPAAYNARVEQAFEERRIRAWPYSGAILIEERDEYSGEGEVFLLDQWCLISSFTYADAGMQLKISGPHRFDYDAYKILSRYILHKKNASHIRLLTREQVRELIGDSYAPEDSGANSFDMGTTRQR